ncbi:hypothetical protein [Brevibacillus laterosporus]|uniref:hypothetical protein n=1 Tax=Brevibacillus laterosporus TaxID=1465 RepID=UPI003D2012BC
MIQKRPNFKKIDERQTKRIAHNLSDLTGMYSRRVGGSGADWRAKGDVYSTEFLFEAKDKEKPSKQRTIYRAVFDKIRLEALHEGKMPVYVVGFGDGDDFMVLRDVDFYHLVDRMLTAEKKVRELEDLDD